VKIRILCVIQFGKGLEKLVDALLCLEIFFKTNVKVKQIDVTKNFARKFEKNLFRNF